MQCLYIMTERYTRQWEIIWKTCQTALFSSYLFSYCKHYVGSSGTFEWGIFYIDFAFKFFNEAHHQENSVLSNFVLLLLQTPSKLPILWDGNQQEYIRIKYVHFKKWSYAPSFLCLFLFMPGHMRNQQWQLLGCKKARGSCFSVSA